mgnify:CR=1 FL=1
MNIFKTFETYLKEPLSILRDNLIQIVSIQTGNIFEQKPSVDVSMIKNKTQITIVNNEKLYNLLSLVTHRKKVVQEQDLKVSEDESVKR